VIAWVPSASWHESTGWSGIVKEVKNLHTVLTVAFWELLLCRIDHSSQTGRTATILLVEDDANLRLLLTHFLRRSGYEVLSAEDGQAACLIWREKIDQIDLLFADMFLPGGLSGLDLVVQMQAEKPGLKAIISSGHSPEAIGLDKPTSADFKFLPKPSSIHDVAKIVRQRLNPT
jgi:DNA-binding NtrC family response regulator